MDDEDRPDPDMKIAIVASLSPQEAALLAGRLEAEGIRSMVSEGRSAPGPWSVWHVLPSLGVGGNFPKRGTADVLVDERDIEKARRIAAQYLDT
jgi:hypothetical protein